MLEENLANQLAIRIQKKFPVTSHPFQVLARELHLTEQQVLEQFHFWRDQGKLREISAIMEGSYLDYDSALVCGKIELDELDAVALVVSNHPNVTHCYQRSHEFNLWFTIAVPPEMSLEEHLTILEDITGQKYTFHPMRRTETFKIGVVFDLKTKQNVTPTQKLKTNIEKFLPDDNFKKYTFVLQKPLPLVSQPFTELGKLHHVDEEKLLFFLDRHNGKSIRKYIATFNHRKMGVKFNAMTVFNISPDLIATLGPKLAAHVDVSHCYARETFSDFPFNVYAMIHGPDETTVRKVIEEIAEEIQQRDYLVLHSTKEYKKVRLRYFLPELNNWLQNHSNGYEAENTA